MTTLYNHAAKPGVSKKSAAKAANGQTRPPGTTPSPGTQAPSSANRIAAGAGNVITLNASNLGNVDVNSLGALDKLLVQQGMSTSIL